MKIIVHQLTGDKKWQDAVNVSGNWRIFFEFIDGDAYIVDYDDYLLVELAEKL